MKTLASFTDESMSSYGFPFPWYAANPITSVAHIVAIAPLVIDMAAYVLIVWLATPRWLRQPTGRANGLVSVALWLVACASLLVNVVPAFIKPTFVAWTLSDYYGDNARRLHAFQFGLFIRPGAR